MLGLRVSGLLPLAFVVAWVACGPANGELPSDGDPIGQAGDNGAGGTAAGGSAAGGQGGSGGDGVGGEGLGAAGSPAGTPPVCGDGYCDPIYESCYWCAADCPCGAGGGGSGGAPPGGGGAGGGLDPAIQTAMDRAKSGVGFSYWWGHGAFLPQGPDASTKGSCSGSCPSCSHSGQYGGDCSGYVAKVWQVPSSNSDLSDDSHPYSTVDFNKDASQWTTVDQGSLKTGDAMVYNNGSAGHIFIFDHGDPWGSMYAYECKGCSPGCTAGMRTVTSSYHAIRRTGF